VSNFFICQFSHPSVQKCIGNIGFLEKFLGCGTTTATLLCCPGLSTTLEVLWDFHGTLEADFWCAIYHPIACPPYQLCHNKQEGVTICKLVGNNLLEFSVDSRLKG
jgi:hypothetical protein